MHPRTKILAVLVVSAAIIASVASASASDGNDTPVQTNAAAAQFGLAELPSEAAADPALFGAITATIDRNSALADVGPITDARSIGDSAGRGIVGVVAGQSDGGLCYELAQQGTLGTGGCFGSFPQSGRAGSHGVVADQFVALGLVTSDVTAVRVELSSGAVRELAISDGLYSWTGVIDDAPTAIVTTRDGATHRDVVEMDDLLAAARQPAPPSHYVVG